MVTPAVNNDITTSRPTWQHRVNPVTGQVIVQINTMRSYENRYRARPESVSNPLVGARRKPDGSFEGGWRKPSGYWYNVGRYILHPSSDSLRVRSRTWHEEVSGGLLWPVLKPEFPSYPTSLSDAAEAKALGRVKEQKVNLGVAFAEHKQTAELLSSTVRRVAESVLNYRRLHPKAMWDRIKRNQRGRGATPLGNKKRKKPSRGKGIPNSWLELQYGWNPLMNDVYGACEALRDKYTEQDFTIGVTGKTKYSAGMEAVYSNGVETNPYNSLTMRGEFEASVKVRLDYVVANSFLRKMSELGVTNPLEMVWEKVPYSFVIDWFLPVGNYLSLLDATTGLTFRGGSRTTVRRLKDTGIYDLRLMPGFYDSFKLTGLPKFNRFSMQRSVYLKSPFPRAPVLKNPLSAGHIANALSLLAGSFR